MSSISSLLVVPVKFFTEKYDYRDKPRFGVLILATVYAGRSPSAFLLTPMESNQDFFPEEPGSESNQDFFQEDSYFK